MLFLYAFLITLTLLVTRQLFLDAVSEVRTGSRFIVPLMLMLTLPLLGALGFQLIRLRKDKNAGRTGSRLKSRITWLFAVITLLASLPQGALALSFIGNSLEAWFSAGFGDSLRGGVEVLLDYHREKTAQLQNLAADNLFARDYGSLSESQERALWRTAEGRIPGLSGLQVYSPDGDVLASQGDETTHIAYSRLKNSPTGLLPKETGPAGSLLRVHRAYTLAGQEYRLVFTLRVSPLLEESSLQMTRSLQAYRLLEGYFDTFRWSLFLFLFLFSLPLFFTTILIAFSLSDDLIRPIVNLEKATRRVSAGDYSIRILTPPHDEMGTLVESFNAMVSELSSSRNQLAQAEKISTWKEIAQQLAHELRNPLTPIRLSAERLQKKHREQGPEALGEILESATQAILSEVHRLETLLKGFSNFARYPSPVKEDFSLGPLLEKVTEVQKVSHPGISFRTELPAGQVILHADQKQLESLVTNLVKNAVEAMPSGGDILVACSLVQKGQEFFCRLRIQDTGQGIPEDHRPSIFNPYFTTKKEGTGLGLSIVERIVFDHNGTLWFESETGAGTTFFIDLPGVKFEPHSHS